MVISPLTTALSRFGAMVTVPSPSPVRPEPRVAWKSSDGSAGVPASQVTTCSSFCQRPTNVPDVSMSPYTPPECSSPLAGSLRPQTTCAMALAPRPLKTEATIEPGAGEPATGSAASTPVAPARRATAPTQRPRAGSLVRMVVVLSRFAWSRRAGPGLGPVCARDRSRPQGGGRALRRGCGETAAGCARDPRWERRRFMTGPRRPDPCPGP